MTSQVMQNIDFEKLQVDAVCFSSRENKCYLSGLYSGRGYVVATPRQTYVLTDARYYEELRQKNVTDTLVLVDDSSYFEHINRIVAEKGIQIIGLEADSLSYIQYMVICENLTCDCKPLELGFFRQIKSALEIERIAYANKIAEKAFEKALQLVSLGITEQAIETELVYWLKRFGAEREAFDVIVASGSNSALPHAKVSDRVIKDGDIVTIDFGARFRKYCSDITRTFCVGHATERFGNIYGIVLEAQEQAIKAIAPNKKCCEIDAVARDIISKAGYCNNFIHNLGHGIGIACHETPYFSSKDQTKLLPGMVMTVEPGIYIQGFGGVRIEDNICVTQNGFQNLTTLKKELLVVF